jgi:hypothetical protein
MENPALEAVQQYIESQRLLKELNPPNLVTYTTVSLS